jgi:CHAD domain-containing protein
LRYAAEAAAPVFGSEALGFARLAEQIQELLGTHQDATVAQGLLRQWGTAAADAGEPTAFTLGLLLGREECRARTAERDFVDFWPEASRARHRRWLR